jgi:hypothetical protein
MFGVRRVVVVLVALLGLLLASAPARAAATDTPVVGQCTNEPDMSSWAHLGQVVDCAGPHTGQTVWVGTWAASASPAEANAYAVGSAQDAEVRAQLQPSFDACNAAMAAVIGGVRSNYEVVSQFTTSYLGPDVAEWAKGQRWAHCDIVAATPLTRKDVWTLRPLPAPSELVGILDRPMKSSPYRLCYWNRNARFVAYEVPASYSGTAFTWPGSAMALLLKARAKCRHNPTVLSYGAKTAAIHVTLGSSKLTKANFKDQTYYCMIEV